jgi:hypothetical protein
MKELTYNEIVDGIEVFATFSYQPAEYDVGIMEGYFDVDYCEFEESLISWETLNKLDVFDDCETAREVQEAIVYYLREEIPVTLACGSVSATGARLYFVRATLRGIVVDLDMDDLDFEVSDDY